MQLATAFIFGNGRFSKMKKILLHGSAILAGRDLKKMKIHFEDNQALSLPEQDAQAG